jgi:hypothetical protein
MRESEGTKYHKRPNWLIVGIAFFIFIITGIIYRSASSRMNVVVSNPVRLPLPLKMVPMQIGNWTGEDISIDEVTKEIAGNDDYISRVYVDRQHNQTACIYLGYSARPRNMIGHNPEVCYRSNGWISESLEDKKFQSNRQRDVNCLIHKFHRVLPEIKEIYVLNFYIVNGRITTRQSDFSGLSWRTPNIEGNPAWYVAQVQINSVSKSTVIDFAENITEILMDYLPDKNGKVVISGSAQEPKVSQENK